MVLSALKAFRLPSLLGFTREVRQELKGVQWPSRETTVRFTVLVIGVSAVVGIATSLLDALLTLGVEQILP